MTKYEYEQVKNIEANKWMAAIYFLITFIWILRFFTQLDSTSIIINCACIFLWAFNGIIRIISYIHEKKKIQFEEEIKL